MPNDESGAGAPASPIRRSAVGTRHCLSWHGWTIALPEDWSPVKIEGDWHKGSILIADFHATRIALRWQVAPKRKFDADKWAEGAIASEVGQLMLKESIQHAPVYSPPLAGGVGGGGERQVTSVFSTGRLFVEPEPPGRDVWVGQSRVSGRLLEVVHQTKTRSRVLRDQILPSISDQPVDVPQRWSIFDLSCIAPKGWTLKSQRMNAGDLTLTFGLKNDVLIVRQIAPAKLALARQPLEKWLDAQQQIWKKMYRVKGKVASSTLPDEEDDRIAVERMIQRRKRFFLLRWISKQRFTMAAHDKARDRIVLVDSSAAERSMQILATIGKAAC